MQPFMAKKDWVQLGMLVLLSTTLWVWVWIEFQKPIIDPAWIEHSRQSVVVQP